MSSLLDLMSIVSLSSSSSSSISTTGAKGISSKSLDSSSWIINRIFKRGSGWVTFWTQICNPGLKSLRFKMFNLIGMLLWSVLPAGPCHNSSSLVVLQHVRAKRFFIDELFTCLALLVWNPVLGSAVVYYYIALHFNLKFWWQNSNVDSWY